MAPRAVLGGLEYLIMLVILGGDDSTGAVEIRSVLKQRANRAVSRATVYTTLDRLVRKGLVDWTIDDVTPESGGIPRRLYRATADGRAEVRRAARAIARLSEGLSLT